MTDEEKQKRGQARLRANTVVIVDIRLHEAAYPAVTFGVVTRESFLSMALYAYDEVAARIKSQTARELERDEAAVLAREGEPDGP